MTDCVPDPKCGGALRRHVAEYILPVAASGLALLAATALDPVSDHATFPLALCAVMVSAWFGGFGPSLVAAVLAAVGVNYFFEVPANSFEIRSLNSGIDLLIFIVIALVISSLSSNLLNGRQGARVQQSRAETARARAEVLAEAGEVLAQALSDPQQVLGQLADLLVRHLAWYCAIDLLDRGVLKRASIAASHPLEQDMVDGLASYSPEPESPHPAWKALRSGRHVVIPRVSDELLITLADNPDHLAALRALRLGSVVAVPLQAHARPFGVITLALPHASAHAVHEIVDLAQAIADRAAVVLEQALVQTDLRHAVASRDVLLASVAHDLRNPLAMIQLGTETARRSIQQFGPTDQARRADAISACTDVEQLTHRMDGYIQELVDVAALQETGGLALHRTPADLVWLVRSALESTVVQDRRVQLEICVPTLPVEVDNLRFLRVLDNLVENALKYSPLDAAVQVSVSQEDTPTGAWATVTVRDHGIGIPAADLHRIFERFYRASNARDHVGGTGLGLWGAQRIVEQLGGTICLQSQEDAGTTVTVRLPILTPGDNSQPHNGDNSARGRMSLARARARRNRS